MNKALADLDQSPSDKTLGDDFLELQSRVVATEHSTKPDEPVLSQSTVRPADEDWVCVTAHH
jgi:hypothetical protein